MIKIKSKYIRVIAGSFRNKTGEVFRVKYKNNKVSGVFVKGVNLKKKFIKKSFTKPRGYISSLEHCIDVSNVKFVQKNYEDF